jgi:hypothetical protein
MTINLNTNSLITPEELELFLGETIPNSDYKNMLINHASAVIERYTDRKLKLQEHTDEVYDGNGSHMLYVKQYPISEVLEVKLWDTFNNVPLYVYGENTEFMVCQQEGCIYLRAGWQKGIRNYRVSYRAGYQDIPFDIKKACADICALAYFHKDKIGVRSEQIGKYSITLDKGTNAMGLSLPKEIEGLLIPYRRITI